MNCKCVIHTVFRESLHSTIYSRSCYLGDRRKGQSPRDAQREKREKRERERERERRDRERGERERERREREREREEREREERGERERERKIWLDLLDLAKICAS